MLRAEVIWYDGEKTRERPMAIIIDGERFEVTKWIPVGVVRDLIGLEREVHKVVLEDGNSYRVEYYRGQDICYIEKLRNW